MIRSLDRTKIALLLAVGFAGVAGLVTLGLGYVIELDAEKLRSQTKELAFQKAQAEEQFETARLLDATKDERASLQDYVVSENTIIDFISTIETQASELGLSFNTKSITPQETKDPTFDNLSIAFTFSGPRENAAFMLTLLESLPYHAHVENVRVGQSLTTWTVDLSLFVTILEV